MMKNCAAALAVTGAAVAATGAMAQSEYPERPITMVISLGAGGSPDLNARVITSIIPTYLEQAVIVRLTPGAGGQLGTQEVANAPADGYTLLFTHNYIDMLQKHVENLPHNPAEDFVTVARVNYAPIAVAVNADSPYETMDDLIAASRETPADTPEDALATLGEAFETLGEGTTLTPMMGRLGENIYIITGDEYEAMRADQSVAYEALVNQLAAQ
ncbi:tripartite tricarboxylate transporter substrate-binding protein [Gymnodinialimonas sp. 57CJ19]|uniref:Bug family tripartite tricarboxylate transporter substrate binding protein n=1 Tax=Gymnodinialimonas sp. 57CJ19 TaxID=3138498 RepID=UPI00313455AE